MARARVPVLALVLLVSVLLMAPGAALAFTPSKAFDIVLVHGYAPTGCPGTNVANDWQPLTADLREDGWTGAIHEIGFYSCDAGVPAGDWIDPHHRPGAGAHDEYFAECGANPEFPDCQAGGWQSHEPSAAEGTTSHNRNTDIRHLAYHLAWYLWDEFTSRGRNVQVVAYSMGGLLVRWALNATQDPALGTDPATGRYVFPPRLLVHNVVTLGTPHAGSFLTFLRGLAPSVQADEMTPGSTFLAQLDANGAPRGADGTDWTVIGAENTGFSGDEVVASRSSTAMCCTSVHRIVYYVPLIVHIGSTTYANQTSEASNATICYGNPSPLVRAANVPNVGSMVDLALFGALPRWPVTGGPCPLSG
jgi:putative serine esterase DUF676